MTSSWAAFLQRFSTPALDQVVFLMTGLGSEIFYMIVLPVLYWTWSKRSGFRVVVFYLFGVYVNSVLKAAFRIPRPSPTVTARVMHPETGPGYSFPSGHAQGSAVFWGQWALEVRRKAAWSVAVLVTVLVAMSRVYLNVHWPIDIAGGLLVGGVLLAIVNLLSDLWARLDPPMPVRLLACLALPVTMYLVHHQDDVYILAGFLLGFPTGRVLEERYVGWTEQASFRDNVLKTVVGLAGLAAIGYGLRLFMPPTALAHVVRYAFAGLWGSAGAPLVFMRMGWHE